MSERPGYKPPDVVALTIEEEIQGEQNMETYIYELQRKFMGLSTYSTLREFAGIVEPRDRDLGLDETAESAAAFFRGGVLGLRAAVLLLPTSVMKVMDKQNIRLDVPDIGQIADPHEKIHAAAASIMDAGRKGLEVWPQFEPYLSHWEQLISLDVRHQMFASYGFGVVMKHADDATRILDLEDLQDTVELLDEYDGWDQALNDLIAE